MAGWIQDLNATATPDATPTISCHQSTSFSTCDSRSDSSWSRSYMTMSLSQMRCHNSSTLPTTTLLPSNRQPYPALDKRWSYVACYLTRLRCQLVNVFETVQSYLTDLHGALTRRAQNQYLWTNLLIPSIFEIGAMYHSMISTANFQLMGALRGTTTSEK
jgi:hypothetical protein